mmetsp:Transcript_2755/g.9917  ORF Transcript_2755/g.9917 Transcript_2755/m.9917 type:complete len:212 (+) Transcript_2755:2238-2873(+)
MSSVALQEPYSAMGAHVSRARSVSSKSTLAWRSDESAKWRLATLKSSKTWTSRTPSREIASAAATLKSRSARLARCTPSRRRCCRRRRMPAIAPMMRFTFVSENEVSYVTNVTRASKISKRRPTTASRVAKSWTTTRPHSRDCSVHALMVTPPAWPLVAGVKSTASRTVSCTAVGRHPLQATTRNSIAPRARTSKAKKCRMMAAMAGRQPA